jgi:hydrogenase maturation factor
MMEGTHVYTARIVEVREDPGGLVGRVSLRGARAEVALDLVPEAREGDAVLVHAGVALTIVGGPDGSRSAGEGGS